MRVETALWKAKKASEAAKAGSLQRSVRSTKRLTNKHLMNLAKITKDKLLYGCGAHNINRIYESLKYVRDYGAPNDQAQRPERKGTNE